MAQIGADPDSLKALGTRFRKVEQQLNHSRGAIEAQLRRTHWSGVDAERFRAGWSKRHRESLHRVSDMCRTAAKQLDRQATEQVAASEATSGGFGWSGGPSSSSAGGLSGGSGVGLSGGSGAGGGGGGSWGPAGPEVSFPVSPHAPEFPDEILVIDLGGEVTAASVMGLSGQALTIESFDERRRMTVTRSDAAGVKVSEGAKVTAGSAKIDLSASAKAHVGMVTRETFETDDAGMNGVLGRVGIGKLVNRVGDAMAIGGPFTGLSAIPEGVRHSAVDWFGKKAGFIPEPARTERLAEFLVNGSIGAEVPALASAHIGATGILRAGVANGAEGTTYIIEAEGSTAGGLKSLFTPGSGGTDGKSGVTRLPVGTKEKLTSHKARFEFFDDKSDRRVVLTADQLLGDKVHRSVTTFDLSKGPGALSADTLTDAVQLIRDGNFAEGFNALRSAPLPLPDGAPAETVFDVDASALGFGATGGKAVTFGVEATAGTERWTRR